MTRIALRSPFARWLLAAVSALPLLALLSGCGDTYCQSGAKYGTQCYSNNDIEWQRTQQREEPWPVARATEPSPGCLLVTRAGVVQQPLAASSSGAPAAPVAPYLMSGGCLSQQQPVYGAVR